MITTVSYYPRLIMARIIFAWLFLILLYFFINHSLLSQLQQPVLIYPDSDNSFWLLHILRIPQYLLRNYWAGLVFDTLLLGSCFFCIVIPRQRLFTWITVIGIWLLYICYCSAAGKHYAQIGYLLAPVPFLALKENKFSLLWDCFRYWVCFLYLSSGIYKIYYGGFAYANNMSHILQQMNADWFIFKKEGVQADTINYLISHPGLAQWFYRLTTLIDLSLIIGFFNKRFDKWLLLGLLSFHAGNFFLLHISFVEQSLIFAPFLPWRNMAKYFNSIQNNG